NLPQGLLEESMLEKEDTQLISGQGPNMQGRKESSKETGKLYEQRVAQASLLQEWINDNAQYALVMIAQNNLALAQKYLILPRVIPLMGDANDPQWLQLNLSVMGKLLNDVSFGRYRIKISKNPLGKKALEMEFQKIMSMNQWLQTLDPSYVDPITTLEHSGINARFKMIAHIKQAQQQIAQQAQAQQQQKQQQAQGQQAQAQQEQQDNHDYKQMIMNHQKVDLLKKMNEIHKSTMENRQLADTAMADHIMNQLF
ncbi:MAG: portal protein, partial [Nitrospiria bacterium]